MRVLSYACVALLLASQAGADTGSEADGPVPAIRALQAEQPSVGPSFSSVEELMSDDMAPSDDFDAYLAAMEVIVSRVGTCWLVNPADPSSLVSVTVSFSLTPEGTVEGNEVTLVRYEAEAGLSPEPAFEAARRAILRCQGTGYALAPEDHEVWRDVVLTFNPSEMRFR